MKTIQTKSGKIITLRSMEENDVDKIFQYAQKIEKEDTFIILNPEEPVSLKEETSYVKDTVKKIDQKKAVHFLALDGSKIIGAASIERVGKRQNHVGRFGIALLKEYRGQGLGRQLMEAIIHEAQTKLNVSQVILDCFAGNKIACQLYTSLGFKEYGRHPEGVMYQGKLIDKLLFYKKL